MFTFNNISIVYPENDSNSIKACICLISFLRGRCIINTHPINEKSRNISTFSNVIFINILQYENLVFSNSKLFIFETLCFPKGISFNSSYMVVKIGENVYETIFKFLFGMDLPLFLKNITSLEDYESKILTLSKAKNVMED